LGVWSICGKTEIRQTLAMVHFGTIVEGKSRTSCDFFLVLGLSNPPKSSMPNWPGKGPDLRELLPTVIVSSPPVIGIGTLPRETLGKLHTMLRQKLANLKCILLKTNETWV
jgi:hypothetical protein